MSLPEKLAQYPTEKAYSEALQQFGREVPEQEPRPNDPVERSRMKLNAAWWPCYCKLPWWGFRRGDYHVCIRPEDGEWLVYEPCYPSRRATQGRKIQEAEENKKRKSEKQFG